MFFRYFHGTVRNLLAVKSLMCSGIDQHISYMFQLSSSYQRCLRCIQMRSASYIRRSVKPGADWIESKSDHPMHSGSYWDS